ncbi:atp dependent lon protease family member [Holotrichia oblita]|nr:atp dependent lon protease family member [Holotrichia oblita]
MENIYSQKENQITGVPSGKVFKMVPTRGVVVFPGQSVRIDIARDKTLDAINKAAENGEEVFVVAQKHSANPNPSPKDIYRVGVVARINNVLRLSPDHATIMVTGIRRMEIKSYIQLSPHFVVEVMPFATESDDKIMLEAVKRNLLDQMDRFKNIDARIAPDLATSLNDEDYQKFIAAAVQLIYRGDTTKQALLSLRSVYAQLEDILVQLMREGEIAVVEKKIAAAVRASIDKNQREFYLREQLKAIKTELGEDEDEIENYRTKIAEKKLPEEVEIKLLKELSRMEKMSPTSPESGVIRTYVEWILDLPWSEKGNDVFDLKTAKRILDEDHYGLDKVKERIIEYLAVHRLTKSRKAPILCFVGPPGVGKTSIVYSIARAAGKKLVTMSLGGVRDEAEIRGHRRTYIGSMPGRIISAMKNAAVINPVFLLDEVDKMTSDFRGDPSSALLEVLDPNQNYNFKDHYLEVPYDLSNVMFIMTANTLDTIAPPLLDRMEIIELSGYTYEEKLQIAKKYLVKKQLDVNGLLPENVSFTDGAIKKIIHSYTRESGVRNLEREIGSVIRKLAVKILENDESRLDKVETDRVDIAKPETFRIKESDISQYLGVERFLADELLSCDEAGVATGLAWTSVGGVTMCIEVMLINGGKGEIILTGSLGEVMKESCQTALSLVKSRAEKYAIDPELFNNCNIHIHFPEGATPKDGPSAGITVATALLSALSSRKVKSTVAMTGEVTLRGKVLAIGGLKEKSLAAYRVGIKTLIIPMENKKDLKDLPKEVTESLDIVLADNIDTVFENALSPL